MPLTLHALLLVYHRYQVTKVTQQYCWCKVLKNAAMQTCYYYTSHAGLLESVSNLTVVPINSTTVLISWSPPFTLEGVPILGYNVTTSGENETMSVEGDTTMLYYSIDHPDPDNNFTVTVVPINGAGPGEDAVTTIEIPGKFV